MNLIYFTYSPQNISASSSVLSILLLLYYYQTITQHEKWAQKISEGRTKNNETTLVWWSSSVSYEKAQQNAYTEGGKARQRRRTKQLNGLWNSEGAAGDEPNSSRYSCIRPRSGKCSRLFIFDSTGRAYSYAYSYINHFCIPPTTLFNKIESNNAWSDGTPEMMQSSQHTSMSTTTSYNSTVHYVHRNSSLCTTPHTSRISTVAPCPPHHLTAAYRNGTKT